MSLLSWLLGSGREQLDPTLCNPTARELREQAAARNRDFVIDRLRSIKDVDERALCVAAVATWPDRPAWLSEWIAREPLAPTVRLISGVQAQLWASRARGSAIALLTSPWAFWRFFDRLKLAERELQKAAELAPTDPLPWPSMITVAQGLELGKPEIYSRFAEARKRAPTPRSAYSAMLNAITYRWGGERGESLRFAREEANQDSSGALAGVVAEAHIHNWVDERIESDAKAVSYFQSADVASDVQRATQFVARQSDSARAVYDRNVLAFCAIRMKDYRVANEHFTFLNGRATRIPWGFAGLNPMRAFRRAEARARRAVRR